MPSPFAARYPRAMNSPDFSRRHFFGAAVAASNGLSTPAAEPLPQELAAVLDKMEPYFTPPVKFGDVSRGNPIPHRLPEARRREVGLTRDTWSLEVISDPENPATLGQPLAKKDGTALAFKDLLKLGEKRSVRFAKIMTCLNLGCPLGMGVWEGVPLRDIVWLTQPKQNLRRVFYHGYHNDDPKQLFRSSLPVGRVLEDYGDLPPVLVCYKLNGQWLSPERGGPVRILVPEHYGFKSVKWLMQITLSNLAAANDTYINGNNDVDSPLKTFAATLDIPKEIRANTPIPITGYAQSGIAGLSKVQVWVNPVGKGWPANDSYFTKAPWCDAHILPPPKNWGGDFPDGVFPKNVIGFDDSGQPKTWPMKLAKAHWAALLPGLPAGEYLLRCRTIDGKGQAQPMPRPFKKSGRAEIEEMKLIVT
jgi:DMSO/TMAO reductase YedYZ molybdopterin-dependent catalytic subunit